MPDYLTNSIVSDGDSLELGIGKVAQAAQANQTAITALQTTATNIQNELDAAELGAGLNANGTYTAPVGTNYLTGATSLKNADVLLDAQIKTNADNIATNAGNIAANTTAIGDNQNELGFLRAYTGKPSAGAVLPQYTSNNVVVNNQSELAAISALDAKQGTITGGTPIVTAGNTNAQNFEALANNAASQRTVTSASAGSTPVVIDTVPLGASLTYVKWEVDAVQGSNVEAQAIYALEKGGVRDITPYAKLRVGNIAGLTFSVEVNGGNLELRVSANSVTQFTAVRRNIHIV
jgi:hypothetical protein